MALVESAVQTINAAPTLITEDSLRFTFPLPDNKFAFLLFSTESDIAGVSVQVRQVKPPDGGPLPPDAVRAVLETSTVTPRGVLVSLTLDPKFFVTPGEYRVVLFFQSGTGTPTLTVTATITRPVADINIDELKDQTVSLTRWFPGSKASNEFLLHVRESTGKVSVDDFKMVGHSLYVKDSKELVPGEVTITPVDPAQSTNITPGAVQRLKVNISKVRYTGAFDTTLLVTSPSFNGSKAIPVKVHVHDFVLLPLAAITLGVVGAYFTRKLVAVVTPRNQNALDLLRLQNEIERFRLVVGKPQSIETIQSLLRRLKRAIENNETGNFAAVREELTKLRSEFDAFRKVQVELESEVQKALTGLTRQVEALEKSGSATPEEIRDLKDKLADIERLCRLGMVEDAQVKIDNVKHLLDDLRKPKLVSYFSDLKAETVTLTFTEPVRKEVDKLQTEIQILLDNNELDKVHLRLTQLKQLIDGQSRTRILLGREGRAGSTVRRLREVPNGVQPAAAFTHIEIDVVPADRIANVTISFTIVDVEKLIQPDDELRWSFGDLGSFELQGMNASHVYPESGRYQVRVEVMRKDAPVKTLTETITILPGEIESARTAILKDLARNEKLLSAIALVLAIIGGVAILYSGKLFGSLADYVMAILWGFGLDNSIKGFASVLSKITPPAQP